MIWTLDASYKLSRGLVFLVWCTNWGPLLPYRFNRGSTSGDSGKIHGIPSLKHFFYFFNLAPEDGWLEDETRQAFLFEGFFQFFLSSTFVSFRGCFVDSLCVSERVTAFQLLFKVTFLLGIILVEI